MPDQESIDPTRFAHLVRTLISHGESDEQLLKAIGDAIDNGDQTEVVRLAAALTGRTLSNQATARGTPDKKSRLSSVTPEGPACPRPHTEVHGELSSISP